MAKQWLAELWEEFFPAIEAAGDDEARIAQICQDEIANWRSRPQMKNISSLRTPMTETRNRIKKTLPLTEGNSWLNPRTHLREHLSLKYLNFTVEEWAQMNASSGKSFQQRLEEQQFFRDPEQIVAVAVKLLKSNQWTDLVVGLAALTGRRLAEVLKTGKIYPCTPYTVMFAGQLKRKDKVLDPYEIPVLYEASLVLDAWERLRGLLDCSTLEVEQISHDYSPAAREAANRWFRDLVPVRAGHDDLYTHLFRTIYGRIALFYFCPPRVNELQYLATIQGHYWVLNADTEETQRHYITSLHYNDYRIASQDGNIDGRQGIKLGEPGVSVLAAFQPRIASAPVASIEPMPEGELSMHDSKKHSIIRVTQRTRLLFDDAAKELNTTSLDDTLQELLVRSSLYNQLVTTLEPLGKILGTAHPIETVVALRKQGVAAAPAKKTGSKRAAEQRELEAFVTGLHQGGTGNPLEYLRGLVEKDANFHAGLAKRHANVDYQSLSLEQLGRTKTEEAAHERFRRAVDAILAHNAAVVAEPLKQWYINAGSVRELVGGRHPAVKAYLESRADEIAKHHQTYGITPVYNRKPPAMAIGTMIKLEVQGDGLVVVANEEV